MITENLQKLYQQHTGVQAECIEEMPASGSNRRYFRLKGVQSLIGVYGTSIEENKAFLYMAEHFKKKNLPVPQVLCVSEDHSCYLQEDLGDTLLFHVYLFSLSVRKLILKEGETLIGDNLDAESVFHLPLAFHRHEALVDVGGDVRMDVQGKFLHL